MPEPSDYSSEVADLLAGLGIEARLIGALAALRYRQTPRATVDVDFLASSLDGVVEALRDDGYEVHVEVDEDGVAYAVFARGRGRRVDILLAETAYQREALERATADVITVEDVIIHKLLAWRARDLDDLTDILATEPDLDEAYLERWIRAWEVEDRWDEVRRTRR